MYSWVEVRVWVKDLFTTIAPTISAAGAASAPAVTISTTPGENGRWVCEPWFLLDLLDGVLAM